MDRQSEIERDELRSLQKGHIYSAPRHLVGVIHYDIDYETIPHS